MDENRKTVIDDKAPEVALDDDRRIKVLSPGMLVFKRFVRNRLAIAGTVIIVTMFLFSFLGGVISPYSESQVFKDYQPQLKEYAAVTVNDEFRYYNAPGQGFDNTAKARMIAAMNSGKDTFENAGQKYGLQQEGEDFYLITQLKVVAQGNGLKGNYNLAAQADFEMTDEFTAAFNQAVAAGEPQFETADGAQYYVSTTKMEAVVSAQENLAIASKQIFTLENGEETSFAFRLEAERTMQDKTAYTFSAEGVTYRLTWADDDVATFSLEDGTSYATASTFVVKEMAVGTVFDPGFVAQVQNAVGQDLTSFSLENAQGEIIEYTIKRQNKQYIIQREEMTYLVSSYQSPSKEHLLGTDGNGMDMLTRLMYGGRISLIIGFVVVIIETVIGVIIGGIAGFFGKWVDNLLMRVVDVFNCIPTYPILILMGAIMDAEKVDPTVRMYFLMIAMGLLGWPYIARMVRGQILSLREQEFMTATEATGISMHRRIFRHLVPNVIPQLIVIDTMNLGGVILMEATLSFLGLGIKYPMASWGSIINAVSNIYVMTNFWFVWIPAGVLILLTVLGFNFIGDGLRDAFDPKMKR